MAWEYRIFVPLQAQTDTPDSSGRHWRSLAEPFEPNPATISPYSTILSSFGGKPDVEERVDIYIPFRPDVGVKWRGKNRKKLEIKVRDRLCPLDSSSLSKEPACVSEQPGQDRSYLAGAERWHKYKIKGDGSRCRCGHCNPEKKARCAAFAREMVRLTDISEPVSIEALSRVDRHVAFCKERYHFKFGKHRVKFEIATFSLERLCTENEAVATTATTTTISNPAEGKVSSDSSAPASTEAASSSDTSNAFASKHDDDTLGFSSKYWVSLCVEEGTLAEICSATQDFLAAHPIWKHNKAYIGGYPAFIEDRP